MHVIVRLEFAMQFYPFFPFEEMLLGLFEDYKLKW